METNSVEATSQSVYRVDITRILGKEYVGMFNDMARFMIIQFAIQIMLVTMDPSHYSIFSKEFVILLLFVIIGVSLYWLVFKKIVLFV